MSHSLEKEPGRKPSPEVLLAMSALLTLLSGTRTAVAQNLQPREKANADHEDAENGNAVAPIESLTRYTISQLSAGKLPLDETDHISQIYQVPTGEEGEPETISESMPGEDRGPTPLPHALLTLSIGTLGALVAKYLMFKEPSPKKEKKRSPLALALALRKWRKGKRGKKKSA